jgi:hypothetical protein
MAAILSLKSVLEKIAIRITKVFFYLFTPAYHQFLFRNISHQVTNAYFCICQKHLLNIVVVDFFIGVQLVFLCDLNMGLPKKPQDRDGINY